VLNFDDGKHRKADHLLLAVKVRRTSRPNNQNVKTLSL